MRKRIGKAIIILLFISIFSGCSTSNGENEEVGSAIEESEISTNQEKEYNDISVSDNNTSNLYEYDDYEYVIYGGERIKLETLLTGETNYYTRADVCGDEEKEIAFKTDDKVYLLDNKSRIIFYEGTSADEIVDYKGMKGVHTETIEYEPTQVHEQFIAFDENKNPYVEFSWGWKDRVNGRILDSKRGEGDYFYCNDEDELDYWTWNLKVGEYRDLWWARHQPWNELQSIELILSNGEYGKEVLGDNHIEIDNPEFEAIVNSVVDVPWNQRIEKTEWIVEGEVFRVAIERAELEIDEYAHLRDYIFVKKDEIKWFEVTYPSKNDPLDSDRYVWDACDFNVKYENVNFDNEKDILIFLGYAGVHGYMKYSAYLYEDGGYRYEKTFENIPNYKLYPEEKCLKGGGQSSAASRFNKKYIYTEDKFLEIEYSYYEYDEEKEDYILVEKKEYNLDGTLKE
ncbi:MAG: hypothetical protein K6A29_08440 [Lachnospiraceae bacterium]|nr:hypothetical protein [Lachnospiraceae bacterium]